MIVKIIKPDLVACQLSSQVSTVARCEEVFEFLIGA